MFIWLTNGDDHFFPSQSSVCAAGRSSSAGVACSRAPSQVAAIPGAQTDTGLQECTGTHWQVRSFFTTVNGCFLFFFPPHLFLSDLVSYQCAHIHLHDRCQPAVHPANYIAPHLGVHRADPVAAEASYGGRWGDPEPRAWGEWGGRARWENTSHQASQNRWVTGIVTMNDVLMHSGYCGNILTESGDAL